MKTKHTGRKVIITDWNDLKSIKKSEREKSRLENAGYTLVKESAGLTTSTLIYEE